APRSPSPAAPCHAAAGGGGGGGGGSGGIGGSGILAGVNGSNGAAGSPGSDGTASGAGVNVQGGDSNVTAQAKNTIIAGNFSTNNTDVAGAFTSHGHNLIGDGSGSSGFNSTVDQVGDAANPIDPQLGPLQNNGGPTRTLTPMPGSPVIDAGDNIG